MKKATGEVRISIGKKNIKGLAVIGGLDLFSTQTDMWSSVLGKH